MAERFEVFDIQAGQCPLLNREHTCSLVLVTLLDCESGEVSETLVEVRLSDGTITRAIVPDDGDARRMPSKEASAFLERLLLGAHPLIESARALAREAG